MDASLYFTGGIHFVLIKYFDNSAPLCYTVAMKKKPFYEVIHSDDSMVVLNKKSGVLVAADRYDSEAPRLDTEASKEFGQLFAVHRIDKDTSGIVLYARTPEAHQNLSLQFQNRSIKKRYHALVNGRPAWQNIRVDLKLLPDGDNQHRTVVNRKNGKYSVTDFTLLGVCPPYSWIEACPITGRTHQIRAHLNAKGLSIVCDPLYGGNLHPVRLSEIKRSWRGDPFEERPLLSRLALHAYEITVAHPLTGEKRCFTAPYPRDMEAVRKQLAKIYNIDPLAIVTDGASIE